MSGWPFFVLTRLNSRMVPRGRQVTPKDFYRSSILEYPSMIPKVSRLSPTVS